MNQDQKLKEIRQQMCQEGCLQCNSLISCPDKRFLLDLIDSYDKERLGPAGFQIIEENRKLKAALDIAREALTEYVEKNGPENAPGDYFSADGGNIAFEALAQIEDALK